MHDDVCAVKKRLREVRRGQRAVDHQGNLLVVGHRGHTLEVEDVTLGVTEGLGEEGLGGGPDGRPPGVEVVRIINEGGLYAELGQGVVKEVVGAAVEGGRRDDVAAVLRQVQAA